MASAAIPLTSVGSGYTIITHFIPSSTAPSTAGQNSPQVLSPFQKFLKGEPKALGAIQIINGLWIFLLGIVLQNNTFWYYSFTFWFSLLHVVAGSLAVLGSHKYKPCVMKAVIVLNILSAISTVMNIFVLSMGLAAGQNYHSMYRYNSYTNGVIGIVLVFYLLQFSIAISICVFACKATCCNEPDLNIINLVPNPDRSVPMDNSFPSLHAHPLNIINVVPNPDGYVPVDNSFPDPRAHPEISTSITAAMSSLSTDSPPAYSD